MTEPQEEVFTGYTPPRQGEIFGRMSKVMGEIGAIGKNQKNNAQGYFFRGIDDVLNAAHPVLVKYGIICSPRVIEYTSETVTMKSGSEATHVVSRVAVEFCAPDGSSVSSITLGEAIDYGDKAANKAMSAAYKYAFFQTLCIPLSDNPEDRDGDFSTPELGKKPAKKTAAKTATGTDKVCPECGKPMRVRKGKNGEFLGCSGYPNCKHTEHLPKTPETEAKPQEPPSLGQETYNMAMEIEHDDKDKAFALCCSVATKVLGREIIDPKQIKGDDIKSVHDEMAKLRDDNTIPF